MVCWKVDTPMNTKLNKPYKELKLPMSIITLNNISKTYPMGKVSVDALKEISLEISRGDFVAIAGPSGSGKTTIMNLIGLIDKPTKGKVLIGEEDISLLSRNKLTKLRHEKLGIIFQSFNLLPVLNVFENVEFPLLIGIKKIRKKERQEWVHHLLEEVGLSDRKFHKPSELSGGQQQRVAIARALAVKPEVIIADEPTANLDSETGEQILELMKTINREQQTTFVFSTHDERIRKMADHIIFLKDGSIVSEHKPAKEVIV